MLCFLLIGRGKMLISGIQIVLIADAYKLIHHKMTISLNQLGISNAKSAHNRYQKPPKIGFKFYLFLIAVTKPKHWLIKDIYTPTTL